MSHSRPARAAASCDPNPFVHIGGPLLFVDRNNRNYARALRAVRRLAAQVVTRSSSVLEHGRATSTRHQSGLIARSTCRDRIGIEDRARAKERASQRHGDWQRARRAAEPQLRLGTEDRARAKTVRASDTATSPLHSASSSSRISPRSGLSLVMVRAEGAELSLRLLRVACEGGTPIHTNAEIRAPSTSRRTFDFLTSSGTSGFKQVVRLRHQQLHERIAAASGSGRGLDPMRTASVARTERPASGPPRSRGPDRGST